ncbi:hypothetical protein OIB37_16865 [Streptomyces sp. NBC_00820]|uniref:hypothetical protein n=1 Tax=Streptomyces sp. NBC_00820 TaxID=2975842 RepID=UPI002ED52461|nr:hypothetical protein OIB37_16865 [Streptomyces sp. NBC_00820]
MTQSGQGDEPSAQPAHEGIVLPSDGGAPLLPGMTGTPAPAAPAGGQAWGGSWGPGGDQAPQQSQGWPQADAQQWHPQQQSPAADGPGPLPPEGAPAPSYGAQAYDSHAQNPAYGQGGGQPAYGASDPYQQQYASHGAPLPPAYPATGAPLPAADGATQYIPPVAAQGGAPEGATQYLPPVPAAGADEGATQYIPPVASGALPPEGYGAQNPYQGHAQQPPAPGGHPDAQATQYIPPVTDQGGDRQPPAEFDNLFRGAPAGGPAGATQQMPRVQDAYPAPVLPQQSSYPMSMDDEVGGRRGSGRTGSRLPLIAAVGVGIVVIGVGAGALFSGGSDDKGSDGKPAAASSAPPTPQQSSAAPAGADPAKQQAADLDRLLADSGGSRASVIRAVGNIRQCDNLAQAAADLRSAAKQRTDLVTRLGQLSVDQLPGNAELSASLTRAWQASASADNHYAAWADQAGNGKKGCPHGHARGTGQTQAGDQASVTASAQKAKAAGLWNAIAQKYGLTQRQPTQL